MAQDIRKSIACWSKDRTFMAAEGTVGRGIFVLEPGVDERIISMLKMAPTIWMMGTVDLILA